MDNSFPRMIYKADGPHKIHGGKFDYCIVVDADELDAALADGWALTTDEANALKAAPVDDAMPTRAELEQKANELEIKFDGRTSDAKLAAKIAAELKD